MKHFPNPRPARLAGLEQCLTHAHRERTPAWPLFWRILAMGLVAFALGFALIAAAWRAAT